MEIIKRSQQNIEDTWNLDLIYKSIDEFNNDFNKVKELLNELKKYKDHILDNSTNLLNTLEIDTKIDRILEKLANYVERKYDEDLSNTISQELKGRFDNLYSDYSSISSFIVPELLMNDFDKVDEYIKSDDKLKNYELLLKRIFRYRDHTLTSSEERILSELYNSLNASERIASIIRNSELQFGTIKDENGNTVELNNENFMIYLKSNDRCVRHDAFMMLYNSYSKYNDTLAECMSGMISGTVKVDKLKHYKSSREASLFSDNIDESIYDNLFSTVNSRLDVLYKYYDLKKDMLKLDDFSLYDTFVNLSNGVSNNYSFSDAKEIVLEVTKVFGSDYQEKVKELYNNRLIDIYPNANKRGGAYSSGGYDVPAYILLNYQNTYNDVSTLIHETGHSVHSMYSKENNDFLYYGYKIFVAEVASTVNELLFNYYMLDHAKNNDEKKFILSEMMDDFKATLYRQTMFAEFEHMMYSEYEKGTILTSELLNNKYLELNKKYFGNNIIVNDQIKYEWMRIPHFYYNYYVYQYATGIASACFIVNRIRNNEENAVNDYLRFLKSGNSMNPVDELRLAGVDIESPEVINKAIDMFESLINEYRKLENN